MKRVADGVYVIGTYWATFYLVEERDGLIFVDAGFPGYIKLARSALAEIGRSPSDVTAIVLTHTHSDHIGGAAELMEETGAPVFVHSKEARLATGAQRATPPTGFIANLWRPRMMRLLQHAISNGGAGQPTVPEVTTYEGDEVLDVPGKPRVVFCPGHSVGHSAVLLEDRKVLFSGDSLVTLAISTGATGPRLHPFNADPEQSRASLDVLEKVDAELMLPGHGEPWRGAISDAVAHARRVSN